MNILIRAASLLPTVRQPTPNDPPGSDGLWTILGWFMFGAFVACMVGVIIGGVRLALARQRGGELEGAKGIVLSLIGAVVCGSAAALVNQVT